MQGHRDREIAIFWDYENVPLPPWCSPAEASKRVHKSVSKYGRIVERRLYFDYSKWSNVTAGGPRDCSSLDLSGFDLVNTPTRNTKETLDKKLIADVLTFAWDCSVRNADQKPCVVLLTSDGDYAYTLAKLRDRGVMNVVMFGRDCSVAQILVDNADVALSFENDVLAPKNEAPGGVARRLAEGSSQYSYGPATTKRATDQVVAPENEEGGKFEIDSHNTPALSTSRNSVLSGGASGADSTHVFLKNLPFSTEIRNLAQFLESNANSIGCVKRANIHRPQNQDSDWCFAHVAFVDNDAGSMVISLANAGRLAFGGRSIRASIDLNIPSSGYLSTLDSSLCYTKTTTTGRVRRPVPSKSVGGATTGCFLRSKSNQRTQVDDIASKDVTSFCIHVYNEQKYRCVLDASPLNAFKKCWVPNSQLGTSIQQALVKRQALKCTVTDLKTRRTQAIRDKAIFDGCIAVGRRRLDESKGMVGVAWHKARGMREDLSTECFLRLTAKGVLLVESSFQARNLDKLLAPELVNLDNGGNGDSTESQPPNEVCPNNSEGSSFVFLKNLPQPTNAKDIAGFLEQKFGARVQRAVVVQNEGDDVIAPSSNAHIVFCDARGGAEVIVCAATNGLVLDDNVVKAMVDKQDELESHVLSEDGTGLCYTKEIEPSASGISEGCVSEIGVLKDFPVEVSEFCVALWKEQKTQSNADLVSVEQCWASHNSMSNILLDLSMCIGHSKDVCKQMSRAVREIALSNSFVNISRRRLSGSNDHVVVPTFAATEDGLSTELFLRLTRKGRGRAKQIKSPEPSSIRAPTLSEQILSSPDNEAIAKCEAEPEAQAGEISLDGSMTTDDASRSLSELTRETIDTTRAESAVKLSLDRTSERFREDLTDTDNSGYVVENDLESLGCDSNESEPIAIAEGGRSFDERKAELQEELEAAVVKKDFRKALAVNQLLEGMQSEELNIARVSLSDFEAKLVAVNEELISTILTKDFAKAIVIQENVEEIEDRIKAAKRTVRAMEQNIEGVTVD